MPAVPTDLRWDQQERTHRQLPTAPSGRHTLRSRQPPECREAHGWGGGKRVVAGAEMQRRQWAGEERRGWGSSEKVKGLGSGQRLCSQREEPEMRLGAIHAPGGPDGRASTVGHVCSPRPRPAREELGLGGRPRKIVSARAKRGIDRWRRRRLHKVGPASTCARTARVVCA